MPIYAYRCSSCGHGADVMQKIADAPLTVCTACGKPTFAKQLTAAGFQLKGSGWYATDFKNKSAPSTPSTSGTSTSGTSGTKTSTDKAGDSASSGSSSDTKPAAHACGSGNCACS